MELLPLIGILASENPSDPPFGARTAHFEAMVKASRHIPVKLFFFSPLRYDYATQVTNGHFFEAGEWTETVQILPDIIKYGAQAITPAERKFRRGFISHIVAAGVRFLNPRAFDVLMGEKWNFYRWMVAHDIPALKTHVLNRSNLSMLKRSAEAGKTSYLKPVGESLARGILILRKEGRVLQLLGIHQRIIGVYDPTMPFSTWLLPYLMKNKSYIYQERARTRPYENRPFDLRVIVQNHGGNDYRVTGAGIRLGKLGSGVSNLDTGGKATAVEDFAPFFRSAYGKDWDTTLKKAYDICLDCADKLHLDFGPWCEMGVDILLTTNRGPIINEANSLPGFTMFQRLHKQHAGTPLGDAYKATHESALQNPMRFARWCFDHESNP